MKNRILTFIIGVLVGAILATAGFFIYSKSINKKQMMMPFENNGQMQRTRENIGEPPEKPQGELKSQSTNI